VHGVFWCFSGVFWCFSGVFMGSTSHCYRAPFVVHFGAWCFPGAFGLGLRPRNATGLLMPWWLFKTRSLTFFDTKNLILSQNCLNGPSTSMSVNPDDNEAICIANKCALQTHALKLDHDFGHTVCDVLKVEIP